ERAELAALLRIAHDEEGPVLRVAAARGADGGIEDALDQRRWYGVGLEVPQRAGGIDRLEQSDGRLRRERCGHGSLPSGRQGALGVSTSVPASQIFGIVDIV